MSIDLSLDTMKIDDVLDCLIANIRQKMKERDFSVAELSNRSGVSPRAINYILGKERKPNIQLVSELAAALGCNSWDLLMPPTGSPHKKIQAETPLLTEEEAYKVDEYIRFLKTARDQE